MSDNLKMRIFNSQKKLWYWGKLSDAGAIKMVPKTITSEQILSLHESSPIQVVSAPGPGKVLVPRDIVASIKVIGDPYSYADLDGTPRASVSAPSLSWGSETLSQFESGVFQDLLTATEDSLTYLSPFRDFESYPYTLDGEYGIENTPIVLSMFQEDVKLIGGLGDLRFSLFYSVVEVDS